MANTTKKKKGNGEGSIYKTDTGYRAQVVVGMTPEGKPIRKSLSGKTFKEVNDKLTMLKNSIITGTYSAPNDITFGELAKLLLKDDLNMNYIKESTYYRNIETLKRIEADPYMKNTPIQKLRFNPMKNYLLSETGCSQGVIDKIYMMVQRVMREAVKRKIITENPIADLKKPKTSQHREKIRALTTDEQVRLYEILTTEDINYSHQMLLSMFTGMRMGEINALRADDVDLNARTISVNKTIARDLKGKAYISKSAKTAKGNREIRISETALPLVREIIMCADGNDYLFMHKGRLLNTSQVNMVFQRMIEKYGITDKKVKGKLSLHSLRHTFATRCIEAGMQAKVLQHILGHTDIKITLNTYCDAFESFQNENIAMADEYLASIGIGSAKPRLEEAAG